MKKLILFLILIFSFLLIYSPHLEYKYPFSIDEWHHITEAYKLRSGDYTGGDVSYRFGFHAMLAGLSLVFDLVKIYHILPALWVLASLFSLYYTINQVYAKSKENGYQSTFVALASMLFFASIKSSVNILGLMFFVPMSFVIPFIYLYLYWFYEGIVDDNKRYLIYSSLLMVILLVIYPLAVLFAVPIIIVIMVMNWNWIIKHWKFCALFLIVPLIGLIAYSMMSGGLSSANLHTLMLKLFLWDSWEGWIYYNNPLELYSLVGYALAVIGFIYVILQKKKSFYLFVIWAVSVLFNILLYVFTSISLFSPFKRNLYYLAIVLPVFSAIGLWWVFGKLKIIISGLGKAARNAAIAIFFCIIFILTFIGYYHQPWPLYYAIADSDYDAMTELHDYPDGLVLLEPRMAMALYPIARKDPAAALHFYGDPFAWLNYTSDSFNCSDKEGLIIERNISYVIDSFGNSCNWSILFEDSLYVYDTRSFLKPHNI
ncbi:hypothetical protein H6503_02505 [Candidatus Woesearchaeota archaeon]|nr:hypothetical protein [Candidatus Woesearchaeota archaeon]